MTAKLKIENPKKYYNLYKCDELVFIEECETMQEFIQLVKKSIDVDLTDTSYHIETKQSKYFENEAYE